MKKGNLSRSIKRRREYNKKEMQPVKKFKCKNGNKCKNPKCGGKHSAMKRKLIEAEVYEVCCTGMTESEVNKIIKNAKEKKILEGLSNAVDEFVEEITDTEEEAFLRHTATMEWLREQEAIDNMNSEDYEYQMSKCMTAEEICKMYNIPMAAI